MKNGKQNGGHRPPDLSKADGIGDDHGSRRSGEVVEIHGLDKDGNPTGNGITLRKTTGGLVTDRLRPDTGVSLSGEERPMMDTIAPMNPLAEILGRLATVAEKWLESQVSNEEAAKPASGPEYLTSEEVAEILRVHVQTVLKLCREGTIHAPKVCGHKVNGKGGKYLIPRESVDAYIAKRTLIHGEKRRAAK